MLIKVQLKRQHSADATDSPSPAPAHRASPAEGTPITGSPPHVSNDAPTLLPSAAYNGGSTRIPDEAIIGSPLKKQRASLSGIDEESLSSRFGLGLQGAQGDVLGRIEQDRAGGESNVGPVAQDQPLFGEALGGTTKEKMVFGGQVGSEEGQKTTKIEEMEEEL